MAEKHTAAIWTGGTTLVAVGGIFMAVTALEPTKKPGTVWSNSWFDLGFALVMIGLLITVIGIVIHFRKEAQPDSALPPPSEPGLETSPIKMTLVDEDWSLVEDTLWVFGIAVRVENTTDEVILISDNSFTNLDDGDRNTPLYERFRNIWPAVNRETKHLVHAHLNDSYSGIFENDLLFSPNRPLVLWYIGETLPPQGGGRPRFTFTLTDSLGNSYDMEVDRRPVQRFRAE